MPAHQVEQQQQPVATNDTSMFATLTSSPTSTQGRNETPPAQWNVEQVVDWLKSKEFEQDICDKFLEEEITGDVLLDLDTEALKSELGISAFGKRKRLTKAIAELR